MILLIVLVFDVVESHHGWDDDDCSADRDLPLDPVLQTFLLLRHFVSETDPGRKKPFFFFVFLGVLNLMIESEEG